MTLEDVDQYCDERVGRDKCCRRETDNAEPVLLAKDSKVQGYDREFCCCYGELVDDLIKEEKLLSLLSQIRAGAEEMLGE